MIKTKEQLKEYLDCEKRIYDCGKMRFVPLLVTEQQVLLRHAVLLRKTEYYYNTRRMLSSRNLKTIFRLVRPWNRAALTLT